MKNAVLLLLISLLIVACAGAPATPEQREVAERGLLAPFLRDTEVECGELLVEMTGNFYATLSQPAVDPAVHATRKERGADFTETIWTNKLGGKSTAFRVTIGEPSRLTEQGLALGPRTKFTVHNGLRLRVYEGTHPMTLEVHATGAVVTVKEAALAVPRQVREFAVVDGAVRMP